MHANRAAFSPEAVFGRYRGWFGRIGHSITDQALFSGANFLMNLWLIRVLLPSEYGSYAIAFTIFLLLSGVHNSFLLEPVSVFTGTIAKEDMPTYLGMLGWLHITICVATSAISLAVLQMLPTSNLDNTLAVMVLLLPLLLLYWLYRRVCYILNMPWLASVGSGIYCFTLLLSVATLTHINHLTEVTSFGATAIASVAASVVMWWRFPIRPQFLLNAKRLTMLQKLIGEHWGLGKWVALQTIFTLGSSQLAILVGGIGLGVVASGTLRALIYVTMPLQQVLLALGGMLMLPTLARDYNSGNIIEVRRKARQINLGFTVLAGAYLLLLVLFRTVVGDLLFPNGGLPSIWLIPAVGFSCFISAGVSAYGLALRATRKVAYYPISTAIPAVYGVIMTPLMILKWGITGSVVNGVLASLFSAILSAVLYRKWVH